MRTGRRARHKAHGQGWDWLKQKTPLGWWGAFLMGKYHPYFMSLILGLCLDGQLGQQPFDPATAASLKEFGMFCQGHFDCRHFYSLVIRQGTSWYSLSRNNHSRASV